MVAGGRAGATLPGPRVGRACGAAKSTAMTTRRGSPTGWEVPAVAKKEVVDRFKLMAPGGQATPAPPLGPVLGAKGVNPGQFIQQFNAATAKLNGKVVGCVVTVYNDRSFSFEIRSSPASVLLREAAGVEKGSGVPNKEKVGSVTRSQLRRIAEEKREDLNARSIEAAERIIEGTARSMGITVEEG